MFNLLAEAFEDRDVFCLMDVGAHPKDQIYTQAGECQRRRVVPDSDTDEDKTWNQT